MKIRLIALVSAIAICLVSYGMYQNYLRSKQCFIGSSSRGCIAEYGQPNQEIRSTESPDDLVLLFKSNSMRGADIAIVVNHEKVKEIINVDSSEGKERFLKLTLE